MNYKILMLREGFIPRRFSSIIHATVAVAWVVAVGVFISASPEIETPVFNDSRIVAIVDESM